MRSVCAHAPFWNADDNIAVVTMGCRPPLKNKGALKATRSESVCCCNDATPAGKSQTKGRYNPRSYAPTPKIHSQEDPRQGCPKGANKN